MTEHRRIYVAPEQVQGPTVRFTVDDLHRIRSVLRLRSGDLLRATDGVGAEYLLRLAVGEELCGEILEVGRPARESPLGITLAQAVPKGDRMGQVIQKSVELGVATIVPLSTSRTVVSPKAGQVRAKHRRWRLVMAEALAQSGRTRIPLLREMQSWEDFLGAAPSADVKIILHEGERRGLEEILRGVSAPASLILAVGPEGGWEPQEVEMGEGAGFAAAGMGPRVLRTETAAPAALSVLQFLYGDLAHGFSGKMDSEKGGEAI